MGLKSLSFDEERLLRENAELRIRLHEAEQALSAIYSGSVDALVLEGPEDHQVFTLRGAETPYRSFVEQMEEGAVSMALDGTILYANQRFAKMVGKPLEAVLGTAFQIYVTAPEYVDSLLVNARMGSSRGEVNIHSDSIGKIPVFASLRLLKEDEADFCMVVTDLTEIVAARLMVDELEVRVDQRTAELLATNLELQGFTYSVSHDMRTPLRAMVSNAHIVMEDEGKNLSPTGCLQLQNISSAALKMSQLVDDLLQYARLGGCALTIERTDLGKSWMRLRTFDRAKHLG
jgi:PAS domain S-box-containing protein